MSQYTKRVSYVEAFRVIDLGKDKNDVPRWILHAILDRQIKVCTGTLIRNAESKVNYPNVYFAVVHESTDVPVSDGDWIVRDSDGTLSVCKHEKFVQLYECSPEPMTEKDINDIMVDHERARTTKAKRKPQDILADDGDYD